MSRRAMPLAGVVLCALALARPAVAQGAQAGAARLASASARRQANVIQVGGAPTALLWAEGLAEADDLDAYAACGLNTVALRVTSASPDHLAGVAELASAASQRGLMVVVAFAPASLRDSGGAALPVSARATAYGEAVREFVAAVVEGLGPQPRLIGWSVEAVRPSQVVVDDRGFLAVLQQWYPSLASLNASWGSEFSTWDEITIAGAREVDSTLPIGIGRASVDYAYFAEAAYADCLSVWAEAIRAADPGRLIFAGGLPDYRSVLSVPAVFDGMVLATLPSVAEADWDTHNVHAVSMARRANRFAAVQTLEVGEGVTAPMAAAWAGLAFAHGAAGVALSSWPELRDSDELRAAVGEIRELVQTGGYPHEPRPQAAVLCEPVAGGAMSRGRSLYGYLDGFAPGTPTNLFSGWRYGSRYGLFDVLRWETLAETDLSQYGAIIAPIAFYLPQQAQLALHNYVLGGGALLTDYGVGMYQAEGTVDSMPAIVREMLGLRYQELGEMMVGREPTLEYGEVYSPAEPTEVRPLAPRQEGREIDPALTRFVQMLEQFVTRSDVAQYLGDSFVGEAGEGLIVKGLGEGFAVYAPGFLYEEWDPSDPYFNEFHERVLSYASDLELVEPGGAWPGASVTFSRDWSVAAASPAQAAVAALVYGAGNQVYLNPFGATRLGDAAEVDAIELLFPGEPLARARPLPIFAYPSGEGATVTVTVVRYGADGIELALAGTDAAARLVEGEIRMVGGYPTPVVLEIGSGAYRVTADSVHRVTIVEGAWERAARRSEVMPNQDTGRLVIEGAFTAARVVIEPAAD